jgi:hypothetical protein
MVLAGCSGVKVITKVVCDRGHRTELSLLSVLSPKRGDSFGFETGNFSRDIS